MNKELKIDIIMVSIYIAIGLIFSEASDYGYSTVDLLIGYIIGVLTVFIDKRIRERLNR